LDLGALGLALGALAQSRSGLSLPYPVHVLEDCEARVSGLSLARALSRLQPARVTVELGSASLRRAIWNLPLIEAVALRFPEAELRISARSAVARLLAPYQRPLPRRARGLAGELEIQLAESGQPARLEAESARQRLIVPDAPYPARLQHASAHAVDAAQAAGLPARASRPCLRIEPRVHKQARALCRRLAGGSLGGPLVVLSPEPGGWSAGCFGRVLALLTERIGARGVVLGELEVPGAVRLPAADPALAAALLALAAVCVGDDGDWAHVAAAVGTPTLIVHGDTSPDHSGPSCRHGVSAFTTKGSCALCLRQSGRRCLPCLDPLKVTALAERLSARRWPLDRLQRVLP
jgi:hypothetical protein